MKKTVKKTNWQTKKFNNFGKGGDAGEVFIVAKKIIGDGKITADGGDGCNGGKGGKVTVVSEDNNFKGGISAKGGKSFITAKKWWEKTWVQLIMFLGAIAGILGLLIYILL